MAAEHSAGIDATAIEAVLVQASSRTANRTRDPNPNPNPNFNPNPNPKP